MSAPEERKEKMDRGESMPEAATPGPPHAACGDSRLHGHFTSHHLPGCSACSRASQSTTCRALSPPCSHRRNGCRMNVETRQKRPRACEPCRKRKIKCTGEAPCHSCAHLGLPCTFPPPPQSTSRSAVQRGTRIKSLKAESSDRPRRLLASSDSHSPSAPFEDDLIREAFGSIDRFLRAYAECIFPTHPIIKPEELRQHVQTRNQDPISTCMTYAAAAAVLDSFGMSSSQRDSTRKHLLKCLIRCAVDSFAPFSPSTPISITCVMICVFIAKCLTALDDPTTAFLYLRHAISMVETFRLDSKEMLEIGAEEDGFRKHRLYWMLFVHERYQCIAEYRAPVLHPLASLPNHLEGMSLGTHVGFIRVIKLFQILDDDFLGAWLGRSGANVSDADWICKKHEQFQKDGQEAEMDDPHLTTAQRADLLITRLWLITLLWRIAMSQKHSPNTNNSELPLLSPVGVSRRLRRTLEKLPQQALEIHGVGIVQKLFELTDTMADVVLFFKHLGSGTLEEQVDDLNYLENIVTASDRLDETRKGILRDKFQRVRDQMS